MSKKCFKCGETKSIGSFYRHKMMRDGYLNKCINCAKADMRLYRKENDSVREYDRMRYQRPERKVAAAENAKRWAKKNPKGYQAHYQLTNAVRDGRVIKEPCEVCGSVDHIHGHHDNYDEPLNVRWLCAKHHHRHHAKLLADLAAKG